MLGKEVKKDGSDFLSNNSVYNLLMKSPLYLDAEDEMHLLTFRKILEISMSQGRWSGAMPRIS